MARLVDLLGEMPAQHDRRRVVGLSARLDRLDEEARRNGAPETTLAAIKGARVLLTLTGKPPGSGGIT